MTNRRFPVAGTNLTIPWEVAALAYSKWKEEFLTLHPNQVLPWLEYWEGQGGWTATELDTCYGKHWREVAE